VLPFAQESQILSLMIDGRHFASKALIWLTALLFPLQPALAARCCCAMRADTVEATEPGQRSCCSETAGSCSCSAGRRGNTNCCESGQNKEPRNHSDCPARCCTSRTGAEWIPALPQEDRNTGEVSFEYVAVSKSLDIERVSSPFGKTVATTIASGSARCIVLCRFTL